MSGDELDAFLEELNDVRLLFDTVTFLWALDSPRLISKKALSALTATANRRQLSAISLSDIAIKRSIGKLHLSKKDALAGIADLKVSLLPYTACHALADLKQRRNLSSLVAHRTRSALPVRRPDHGPELHRQGRRVCARETSRLDRQNWRADAYPTVGSPPGRQARPGADPGRIRRTAQSPNRSTK